MRVPYIISKLTQTAYETIADKLNLEGESERKLVSENFLWDNDRCPSLEHLSVEAIQKYFIEKPLLDELPCADKVHLLEILPTDLPLKLTIPLIEHEFYWQRCYKDRYGTISKPVPKDWTWKCLYLESYVEQLVTEAQPQYGDEETFDDILQLCHPFVKRLIIDQLQCWKPPLTMSEDEIPEQYPEDHIHFLPIFKKLPYIEEFDLIFGMNNVGEDFTWNIYKVSVADCQKLGRALLELKHLRIVKIHRSRLEYEHCQALLQGLVKHKNITELDLSHCEIGDGGALCVAYLLQDGTNLINLRLVNNKISTIGSEAIGFSMLSGNCDYLTVLDLRLNPLRTEGTMGILRAMVRCEIPKELNLAACMFEDDTPIKISQMIKLNESLRKLDVSCNWFGIEGGKCLVDAVDCNTTLHWVDVRETDMSHEQMQNIKESLARNRKLSEADSRFSQLDDDNENDDI